MTAHDASQVRPGVTRRDLLKLATAAGLAPWLLPGCSGVRPLPALLRSRGPLPLFATHLPIPPALAVTCEGDGSDRCTLTLREGMQQILPDRTTLVWGGDGMFPCPTIEARSGRRLVLHLRNELPVPTVIHLHGGKTPAASDGYPTDLVLPAQGGFVTHGHMHDPRARVAQGEREHEYPNDQRAATLWYHDHRMTSRDRRCGAAWPVSICCATMTKDSGLNGRRLVAEVARRWDRAVLSLARQPTVLHRQRESGHKSIHRDPGELGVRAGALKHLRGSLVFVPQSLGVLAAHLRQPSLRISRWPSYRDHVFPAISERIGV